MDSQFQADILDQSSPYATDFSSGSDTLLITFAGISGALGLFPFEFFKITRGFAVDKIFIRDFAQSWYHQGMPGVSTTLEGTADYLRDLCRQRGYRRVVCLGNSMGGYAALVVGHLIAADEIIAFSPQTFLDQQQRQQHGDNRWPEEIAAIPGDLERKWLDLGLLYSENGSSRRAKVAIYFSTDERIDAVHARKLEGSRGVTLHPYENGGHQLVQLLRREGELYRILRNSLTTFSEDRVVSVFREREGGRDLLDACHRHQLDPALFATYAERYGDSSGFQGDRLYRFLLNLREQLCEIYSFRPVESEVVNGRPFTREMCRHWYGGGSQRQQMFGFYVDFGDADYLLHLAVGSNHLHLGFVRYQKDLSGYTLQPMSESELRPLQQRLSSLSGFASHLTFRGWGHRWCSVDLGDYSDLSHHRQYQDLGELGESSLCQMEIAPLARYLQEERRLREMVEMAIFTPGPVRMYSETLRIGATQTPYFRNQQFSEITLECESALLQLVNAPEGSRVLFLTASGTAAMEATVQNLLGADNSALVVNGGGFGQRFVDICALHNLSHRSIPIGWGENLADTSVLQPSSGCDTLLINAHETSLGHLYAMEAVGRFCHEHGLLHIVDAISMFVTDPLDMDQHHMDVVIVSSHKGLALPPGLSMVILSPRAIARVTAQRSLYFDFNAYLRDGLRGQTPFTPAVTILLQLHARLRQLLRDGIGTHQRQAARVAHYFRDAIQPLPLAQYTPHMPNAMTTLTPTDGRSALEIVNRLEQEYQIAVAPNGGSMREKIFRVAHMGNMDERYTDILVDALFAYYKMERK
ncbi:MAG: alanine--glyoxylate aminotransferase family protein [Gammaproteobacteria bacterium]|nr:alanine--glyoxylate aminotransferase family protein [Gammaproteobacteria bacterium]